MAARSPPPDPVCHSRSDLGASVEAELACPNTMVDRIVPATTDADRARVNAALGVEDAWPVVTEPFTQWVIEDLFPLVVPTGTRPSCGMSARSRR